MGSNMIHPNNSNKNGFKSSKVTKTSNNKSFIMEPDSQDTKHSSGCGKYLLIIIGICLALVIGYFLFSDVIIPIISWIFHHIILIAIICIAIYCYYNRHKIASNYGTRDNHNHNN